MGYRRGMGAPSYPLALDPAAAAALVALRRDIHEHPELAGGEHRTARLVADRLRAAGLTVTTGVGGHGVVAVLDGCEPGPTVAYRADMDAVDTGNGAAHLCGHDLHTAIGVGIAELLANVRANVPGRVVFVFQPAEETLAGAEAMISDGVIEQTKPDEIYALHCAPMPVGAFAVMPGFGHPGLDQFQIALTGPTARDDGTRLIAMIEAMSTVAFPETETEFQQIAAHLGTPDGPLSQFVLAQARLDGAATVLGWVRAWPDDRYPAIRDEIRQLAESVSGARLEFPKPPFPAMVCSPELSTSMASHLRDVPGVDAVEVLYAAYPFNGEDFALFLREVSGAMCYLGVANDDAGLNGLPHSPDFGADDRAVSVAVQAMASLLTHRINTLRDA